jgi:hypothetical protein
MTTGDTGEQREVRDRVVRQYHPAWCAAPYHKQPFDPSAFVDDWDFLTPGLAHWFLLAIDEGVVEVTSHGDISDRRGSAYTDGIFETAGRKDDVPRRTKVRQESFFEVAAVGMLAVRYGWPAEQLTFQPERGSLDFAAYDDEAWSKVTIAGEAKRSQPDAIALSESLEVCGGRGNHLEADCTEHENHHRKYVGLLKLRPRIFWIVGPEAFAADPDLVFRVEASSGGIVRLDRTDAGELTSSSP